jgi:two-component system phosphate regulon sensor histidine kinase PhoR
MNPNSPQASPTVYRKRLTFLVGALVIVPIVLSWLVYLDQAEQLAAAAVSAYQNTQLDMVRAAATSIQITASDLLAADPERSTVELAGLVERSFIEPLRLLNSGSAWMFTPSTGFFKGRIIRSTEDSLGNIARLFEGQQSQGAAEYAAVVSGVLAGQQGVGSFVWDSRIGRELTAWTPFIVNRQVWVVGMSVPLTEVLAASGAVELMRQSRIVVSIATIAGVVFVILWFRESRRQTQLLADFQESEARNRATLSAIPDALYRLDGEGRALDVVPAKQSSPASISSKLLGQRIHDVLPKAVARQIELHIRAALRSQTVETVEYTLDADSSPQQYEMRISPISTTEVIAIVRDITERKRAEQQAQALRFEQERLRIVSDFIRDASHEFRTPLSLINTKLYLFEKSPSPVERKQHAEGIQAQVDAITRLINDMVLLTSMDQQPTWKPDVIEMNIFLRDRLQQSRNRFDDKNVRLTYTPSQTAVFVVVQRDLFAQAFQNVLDNALRYTPPNGWVQVSTHQEGTRAVLEICDSGIGISAEDLPRIFDTFYRVDKARSTRGFGLGLPIARKIIERHNGIITAESEPGRGSTFRIALPIADPTLAASGRPVQSPPNSSVSSIPPETT